MDIALRNRQIKKVIEAKFGRGNVRVKGSRGTAYGLARVTITTTKDGRYYSDRYAEVMKLLRESNVEFYHYYGDDGSSDQHACINISFEELIAEDGWSEWKQEMEATRRRIAS